MIGAITRVNNEVHVLCCMPPCQHGSTPCWGPHAHRLAWQGVESVTKKAKGSLKRLRGFLSFFSDPLSLFSDPRTNCVMDHWGLEFRG